MVGEEERKEERKEGSKEREKRKRKERGRGGKGGQIDCRSPHVKLFMNFHYLQINSGAFVWLPRLLMFPYLLPPFLLIFNLLQHKTIFGVLNGYSFPGLGLGCLAWDSFTIPLVPVTWLTLPYPQDFSVKLSPLLAYPSPSLQSKVRCPSRVLLFLWDSGERSHHLLNTRIDCINLHTVREWYNL